MIQIFVCSIVICFFFFLLIEELYKRYSSFSNKWSRLIVCFILALIFKFDFGLHFYGLEYEDSYVFDVLAKYIAIGNTPSTFMAEVPTIGSLTEPFLTNTYGGHFITYSVFLSWFYKVLGFSQWTLSIATSIISLLVLLLLSTFSHKHWYIAPILFCVAPIINVFGNSGLSELFSSLVILAFCISYINYRTNRKNQLLSLVSFALALLCKRENLILILLPCVDFCIALFSKDKKLLLVYFYYCLSILGIVLVYLLAIRNVFAIEAEESVDIASATFSFDYFKRLFPVFVSSLLNPSFFSVLIYLSAIKLIYDIYKKQCEVEQLLILLLFVSYVALYTLHYRGYFFVKYNNLSVFDSFRYLNNCVVLLVLYLSMSKQIINKKLLLSLLLMLLSYSCYKTFVHRIEYRDIENENRFALVDEVCEFITTQECHSCIITSTPLLYQIRDDISQNIVDVTNWNRISDKIDYAHYSIYLVLDFEKDYIATRYNCTIELNKFIKVHETTNGTSIYKYFEE